jgi:hypothetical protein
MRFGAFFGKFSLVMPGLDPDIHQISKARWIAGSSPAMTLCRRSHRPCRLGTVNDAATSRRILRRSGTAATYLHDFKTTGHGLRRGGESPLSDAAAC